MQRARWIIAVAFVAAPVLVAGGCTKKKQKATPGETGDVTPGTPGMGVKTPRPNPDGPRKAVGEVPKLKGKDAPPAEVAKALGAAPKLLVRANLATWMASAMVRPLLNMSKKVLTKELKECAKHFRMDKLKRAFFVQSTGQLIRRAEDASKDSHYIVFDAGFDVPALLACLAKAKTFAEVKLNGVTAYQPPTKKPGQPSWWFAAGKTGLVIVDGPWAKKVTPGKGLLGTDALLKHVGPEALRIWADGFAPDIPKLVAYLNLGKTVEGRADVTWRDTKDAKAMPALLQRFRSMKPEMAKAMKPLTVAVKGKVTTFTIRASQAEAVALTGLVSMVFRGQRDGSQKGPPNAKKGPAETGTASSKTAVAPKVAAPKVAAPKVAAPKAAAPKKKPAK